MFRFFQFHLFFSFLFSFSALFSNASFSWNTYKELIVKDLASFPGWCSREKAEVLMDFIYDTRPGICVEIGTFGGSTTYPIACSLRFIDQGILYTIDAWDNQAAIEGLENNDPNREWWKNVDMNGTRSQFKKSIKNKKLSKWCNLISKRSKKAVSLFSDESIDFLYIDGNLSSDGCYQDVVLYFPKVKTGGFIWLNEADSDAKNKSVVFLMNNCSWLREQSIQNRCIVFKK
ncbi:MAG: hypothetical protein K1000chlam3_00765 [Chlamydiae bacterium]|nr:hypothetical protein [Chlamydiota bacterium]